MPWQSVGPRTQDHPSLAITGEFSARAQSWGTQRVQLGEAATGSSALMAGKREQQYVNVDLIKAATPISI